MFFATSLVGIVCSSSNDANFTPRVLYLYNTKAQQIICLIKFDEDIQAVKLNYLLFTLFVYIV
jgi:hypothetical protein